MVSQSQARTRKRAANQSNSGAGAAIRSMFESPLFREVLANALVAAAGAAAATLIRHRPESASRVAKVAAAATSLTATSSNEELTEAGKQAVRDLASRVGREVIPGLMAAVTGSSSERSDDREQRPKRSKSRAGADDWR